MARSETGILAHKLGPWSDVVTLFPDSVGKTWVPICLVPDRHILLQKTAPERARTGGLATGMAGTARPIYSKRRAELRSDRNGRNGSAITSIQPSANPKGCWRGNPPTGPDSAFGACAQPHVDDPMVGYRRFSMPSQRGIAASV